MPVARVNGRRDKKQHRPPVLPKRISDKPAERVNPRQTRLRLLESHIYTDGACINNGEANARCGSGIWFGPNHRENKAIRVPGNLQSNQVGELVAIIAATEATPPNQPLVIVMDSRYAIEGLTTHLGTREDRGWIGIRNANLFKKAAYLLRRRTARTTFKWIKGHTGDQGNEGSDQLAKEGANKEVDDPLDSTIPIEFDLHGAKLASLTQKDTYKGICGRKKHRSRKATDRNLQLTRNAIKEYNGEEETDPHENPPWPNISMGLILGCGCITTTREELQRENENRNRTPNQCGAMRLLNILITESAYLIWVLRCERAIREKTHTGSEIRRR